MVNTLIRWNSQDEQSCIGRILWIGNQEDRVYIINVKSNSLPYPKNLSEIKDGIKNGIIKIEEIDNFIRIINEEDIKESDRQKREKAWMIINSIVDREPQIYIPKQRKELVTNVSSKNRVSEKTVLNYLFRYWARGKTKNGLLPDYYLCGGKGKEKTVGSKKIGRPRKHIEVLGQGVNVNEEIKKTFKIALNKYYYTSAKNSLATAYELMLKDFFVENYKIQNGLKMPILKPSSEVPTLTQFRYWYRKENSIKQEITSRFSVKKYEQKYRPVLGNAALQAIGPAYKYEIDATIADVYLVSRFNRNFIIGRPILYTVVDVFSRMIVGIYIGLEGPSWLGAMMALANCASKKVAFCKEYGIDIEESEWPVHYLPEYIIADRGELEGWNIENLINSLHVKVQNTPPYRADWKPFVEKYFNLINQRVKPLIPGVVNKNARERGDKDYRLDSKLDLFEFTQIIIKTVLYYNNNHFLRNYNRQEMQIEDEIQSVPVKLWNWGLVNRSGKLRYVQEDIVKLSLMPVHKAAVTGQGIKFKNLYYSSKRLLKERWFENARTKGSFKIDICYDPRNMDFIYIKSKDGRDYEKCFLLEHMGRYKNKTLEEIENLIEYEKLQLQKFSDIEMQSKIDLITEIEGIVKKAEKASITQIQSNESNSKKIKGIRSNRLVEKSINRTREGFELDGDEATKKVKEEIEQRDKFNDNARNEIIMLRKKQKEALKDIHG